MCQQCNKHGLSSLPALEKDQHGYREDEARQKYPTPHPTEDSECDAPTRRELVTGVLDGDGAEPKSLELAGESEGYNERHEGERDEVESPHRTEVVGGQFRKIQRVNSAVLAGRSLVRFRADPLTAPLTIARTQASHQRATAAGG